MKPPIASKSKVDKFMCCDRDREKGAATEWASAWASDPATGDRIPRKERIDRRREAKKAVVEMLISCAEIGPLACEGFRGLTGEQTGNVTLKAGEFWQNCSTFQKEVYCTAKGCTNRPRDAELQDHARLADFLKVPTLSPYDAGCMGMWVSDGVRWAKQIVDRNPKSFPDGWKPYRQRIDRAIQAADAEDKKYINDPAGKGPPKNLNQAYAYLLFEASRLDRLYQQKEKAKEEWLGSFNEIPEELRKNPTIEIYKKRGFEFFLDLSPY